MYIGLLSKGREQHHLAERCGTGALRAGDPSDLPLTLMVLLRGSLGAGDA